jgi:hypothetical protein
MTDSLRRDRKVKPNLAIGLSGQGKSAAAIAGLRGLIGDGGYGFAIENSGAFAN